jgi:hypothetical protein
VASNHVSRPLYVVLAIAALFLIARLIIVPSDFGIHDQGYMFGFHRLGNEAEWKAEPVMYMGTDYCAGCHEDKAERHGGSSHYMIQCENCHGPGAGHPDEIKRIEAETQRGLCLRCHAALPYPDSGRAVIPGIEPDEHYPGNDCVYCHNPHDPAM